MGNSNQLVVMISTQAPLIAALERHFERVHVRSTVLREFPEFYRRVVSLRPTVLVVDEWGVDDVVPHLTKIRAHPVCAKIPLLVLCSHGSPQRIHAMHEAGSNDIMLLSHHTPRDIVSRVQALLSL